MCETGRDVERVLVDEGTATGVRLADGETVTAGRAVIANVTPTQLYERLLGDGDVPADLAGKARRYRYGRGEMQIHLALSEPPRWEGDERLGQTAIVHVTPGLDGVSRAVNEADRGLLPAEATIVVGQPLTMDPSRAPEGAGLLWIQLQELPSRVRGDAAGELDAGDGTWTEELRERYADRIVARLARQIPNLESAIKARVVLSPADLEPANVNLLHGDPYGGSLALDQNFLWRPFPASPGHATAVDGSGISARARTPGRGSVPARGRWSRSSSSDRRCPGGRAAVCESSSAVDAALLDLADHDVAGQLRGGPPRVSARPAPRESGSGRSSCVRARRLHARRVPRERARVDVRDPGGSVHRTPTDPGPDGPGERVEAYCAGLRRLKPFEPTAVVLLTGPGAREVVLGGLETIAAEARSLGLESRSSPTAGSRASSGRSSTRSARRPR